VLRQHRLDQRTPRKGQKVPDPPGPGKQNFEKLKSKRIARAALTPLIFSMKRQSITPLRFTVGLAISPARENLPNATDTSTPN
jgi:hypothetical protein